MQTRRPTLSTLAAAACLTMGIALPAGASDLPPTGMPYGFSFGGNLHNDLADVEVAHGGENHDWLSKGLAPQRADGHAPIGVMGDHMHKAGEWMVSYRFMSMQMSQNMDGTDKIGADTIVTTVANRFGTPAKLRVVPREMTTNMHMVGGMYAPTDWLTLMAMGGYAKKSMSHTTYSGMAGTTVLGSFDVDTSGMTDTRLSGLLKLYKQGNRRVHLNLGVSLPTGSYKESAKVLAPSGARPDLRTPYAMQLGSGTFDLMPGVTYTDRVDDLSWGAQFSAYLPLGKNDAGYSLGRSARLTAWGAYQWEPWISTSLRVTGQAINQIDGIDSAISAPVQTADPYNYGGDHIDLAIGVNLVGQKGLAHGHRLAAEISVPLHEDLNGPQLSRSWAIMLGYQKAF